MRRFIGAALMGLLTVSLTVYEWDFGRRARAGQAVVLESGFSTRSGATISEVLHIVNGEQIRATLRAWGGDLRPGQQVRILFLPREPTEVVLDRFWQRHGGSTVALLVTAILSIAGALNFAEWHRRRVNALLRDDYVDPRMSTRGMPLLPIDTAPPLWDHELDG
jgi:hypothetical protein